MRIEKQSDEGLLEFEDSPMKIEEWFLFGAMFFFVLVFRLGLLVQLYRSGRVFFVTFFFSSYGLKFIIPYFGFLLSFFKQEFHYSIH